MFIIYIQFMALTQRACLHEGIFGTQQDSYNSCGLHRADVCMFGYVVGYSIGFRRVCGYDVDFLLKYKSPVTHVYDIRFCLSYPLCSVLDIMLQLMTFIYLCLHLQLSQHSPPRCLYLTSKHLATFYDPFLLMVGLKITSRTERVRINLWP